jgi:MoxR-like ATPase
MDPRRKCPGFGTQPEHEIPDTRAYWRNDTIRLCRSCQSASDHTRRYAAKGIAATRRRAAAGPKVESLATHAPSEELASDAEVAHSHQYVPMPELLELERTMVEGAKKRPAGNMIFTGPSGCGKTDAARDFAARIGLPYTKIDAASMTDPESWFGTRELVIKDGVAVTEYRPSAFIESIQRPGVTLIDEVTRVVDRHRNILLPIIDHTRAVLNPLTGEVVQRHPMNFIIMAGNVGMAFTGTTNVDPAFYNRARHIEFDYIDVENEQRIVKDAGGCDAEDAFVLVRFATDTRAKARMNPDHTPISTRQLIEMSRDIADGMSRDLTVKLNVLNNASDEGAPQSIRQELVAIWNGVRDLKMPQPVVAKPRVTEADSGWVCPTHGTSKIVPAGVSKVTGKPYASFRACGAMGCSITEDRVQPRNPAQGTTSKVCGSCGDANAPGLTYCVSCGIKLP